MEKQENKDMSIAYQNKDIVSKYFGDRLKGKKLSLFGLTSELKVVDILPTNLPLVKANELRIDNLFKLEDGSLVILDYESTYKKSDFIKYGSYILGVSERYLKENKEPDIHMMVLYTADIEKQDMVFHKSSCDIRVEASFLVGTDSEKWKNEVRECVKNQEFTDEMAMRLVLLPLTYKGDEEKQTAIRESVELARQIPDKDIESFVLSGILAFTDKVINEKTRNHIKEVLSMTQVGKMLKDEGRIEGRIEGRTEERIELRNELAKEMLADGKPDEEILKYSKISKERLAALKKELFQKA